MEEKYPKPKKIIVIIQDLPVGLCINYDILCRNWLYWLNELPHGISMAYQEALLNQYPLWPPIFDWQIIQVLTDQVLSFTKAA